MFLLTWIVFLVFLVPNVFPFYLTKHRNVVTTKTHHFLFNFNTKPSSSANTTGGAAKIPSGTKDRNTQAINGIKAAIKYPRTPSLPLIECEFPVLEALNKLGDGSLRSALEAEDANISFVQQLVKGISPGAPLIGPKVLVVVSSSASKSFLSRVQQIKGTSNICSLKDGIPTNDLSKDNICIFITPSTKGDYQAAVKLAESQSVKAVIIVNGFAKDQKSIPGTATMAYYLKPLTYNSRVAGYLIRSYPSSWTVLDSFSKEVLATFSDSDILVKGTNTPDLRDSVRLIQKKSVDDAIRYRNNL